MPEALYGPWDYSARPAEFAYDETPTYADVVEFLDAPDTLIEDWGCGGGWLSKIVKQAEVRGIDGAEAPWVDVLADLRYYRSSTPRANMRHVLEHNLDWREILTNFCASFTDRATIVTFVPFRGEYCKHKVCPGDQIEDQSIQVDHGLGEWAVPDLHLPRVEFLEILDSWGLTVESTKYETESQYGREEVFHLTHG